MLECTLQAVETNPALAEVRFDTFETLKSTGSLVVAMEDVKRICLICLRFFCMAWTRENKKPNKKQVPETERRERSHDADPLSDNDFNPPVSRFRNIISRRHERIPFSVIKNGHIGLVHISFHQEVDHGLGPLK